MGRDTHLSANIGQLFFGAEPGHSGAEKLPRNSTLIAAESVGRVCFAVELSPAYVDVAVKRWQAFTGHAATLLADGRTFDVVAAERIEQARQPDAVTPPPAGSGG